MVYRILSKTLEEEYPSCAYLIKSGKIKAVMQFVAKAAIKEYLKPLDGIDWNEPLILRSTQSECYVAWVTANNVYLNVNDIIA